MFAGKAWAIALRGIPLEYAPALLFNIRLGFKDLAGTNTLSYLITTIKSFTTLATGC